jgi:membrane protease YdiL (CAAX protease family)
MGVIAIVSKAGTFRVTPLAVALPMVAAHVVAEEIFFRGYVAKVLREEVLGDAYALVAAVAFYAAYHLTFHGVWFSASPMWRIYWCGILGVGAGAVYTFLYLRSGSIWPPIVCHFIAYAVPMIAATPPL